MFDCFGAREALVGTITAVLPEGVRLPVASIPALTLLKVTAWQDRKRTHPGRDAPDLLLYMRSYLDCGNLERATREHSDLFAGDDFDYTVASARLLARDVANFLDADGVHRVLRILLAEADEEGALLLAHQSGMDLERARRLAEVFCGELG